MAARRVARVLSPAIATLVVVTLAGGCGASQSSAPEVVDQAMAYDVVTPVAPGVAAELEAAGAGGNWSVVSAEAAMGAPVPVAAPAPAEALNREVITTGDVSIRADNPVEAANDVVRIAEQVGGRVDARNEQRATEAYAGSAWLQLRVPSDQVNTVISELDAVGEVTDVSINRQDVTATGRDLDARIAALETSTARLSEFMANAHNTSDLLEAERELADRQAQLDGLRAQRAALTDQVVMSTLNVNISATVHAIQTTSPGFLGGLASGWQALVSFGRGLTVFVGALIPWLVPLALLAFLGRFLWQRWRRARAARTVLVTPPSDPYIVREDVVLEDAVE